ncbi:hypothetical protein BD626DRAFT_571535 [Schizophyllum amplum]|uniref:Fungal-type protein kinase domain-containing protein n=1 Tax=Schizophyllum amplum TaxID=97359 RepID=A0A550C7Q2_9AGAR|nr:hypothetical protein BD626DRAFT_571535 [Auriculariopsis ampla]
MDRLKQVIASPRSVKVSSTPGAVMTSSSSRADPLSAHDYSHHDHIDSLIHDELSGDATRNQVPNLVEHIFPDHALPISIDEVYKAMTRGRSPLYSPKRRVWRGAPDFWLKNQEHAVADWFEKLASAAKALIAEKKKSEDPESAAAQDPATPPQPKPRRWSADFCDEPLSEAAFDMKRKPDIVGLDELPVTWKNACVDVQIKSNEKLENKIVLQLHDGAFSILSAQDIRLFHIGCGIAGDLIWVNYYDRSGCLRSRPASIHAEPLLFLRILLGLTLLDKNYLGYDSTIEVSVDDERFVTVEGVKYEILHIICQRPGICGLATVCWLCQDVSTEDLVVIKNSWMDRSRANTEADLLRKANEAGVKGIPTVIGFEFVERDDARVSTARIREDLLPDEQHADTRELTRLVMKECYDGLAESFTSPSDLLSLLRDSVEAHKSLYEDAKIIHADISDKNIVVKTDPLSGKRRGCLIDLNYAIDMEHKRESSSKGSKSAQVFFISPQLLTDPNIVSHDHHHDLDSFLFVLMWITFAYGGPGGALRVWNIKNSEVAGWMDKDKRTAGNNKQGTMSWKRVDTFGYFLQENMAPYFVDLQPCILELRSALFVNVDKPATHSDMINILTAHIDRLRLGEEKPLTATKSEDGHEQWMNSFAKPEDDFTARILVSSAEIIQVSTTCDGSKGADRAAPTTRATDPHRHA